jgi:methionyl-tRNA synthetase
LVGNVGNFVHRVLSFVARHFERRVPVPEPYDAADRAFVERIEGAPAGTSEALEAHHVDRALRQILEFAATGNQYFQAKEPWRAPARSTTCLYLGTNAVATLAVLLAPYLPFSMERLWGRLGLSGSVHQARWDHAGTFQIPAGHAISEPEILFRKIENQEVAQKRAQLVAAVQRSAPGVAA